MALLGLIPEFKDDVRLRMTPEQAKTEATGRTLALIGSVVGMVGGVMVLSVNPAFRKEASGAWEQMPKEVKQNKVGVIIIGSLGLAGLLAYNLKRGTKARYGDG